MARLRDRRLLFALGVLLVFVVLGLADRQVGLRGQLGLGVVMWAVLLASLSPLPLERRLPPPS